jgi:glutathione S-transferase
MADLIAARYSPYSERARWALDHHAVAYREKVYTPMLGEPFLRLRARKWRGKITVPVFVDGKTVLRDSIDIARHADAHGRGQPLFPPRAESEIASWIRDADAMLDAGRALLLPRLVQDRAAAKDTLPSYIPGPLRGLFVPLAIRGSKYLIKKHVKPRGIDPATDEATIRRVLDRLRGALAGGRSTILDGLTFADVVMAAALNMVRPVESPAVPLGDAERRAWTREDLVQAYPEVVAWRDRLYAERRGR